MVSKERLEQIASGVAYGFDLTERTQIARELLAWRKAASEPVAYYWFNESDYGRDVSLTSPEEDDDAADAFENGWQVEPLIRIPKLTGGDEC
ncbi:hypothetical protein [[Erwinia] mediterraneensis]|uniref:hypothetical protein n=1 Tax=[Erwinia] mediterraneensis TaxID=2161819 RepID=UPI00103230AC|nr:hypothetical protein [[Erwinia] mediterraneensis]